MSKQETVVDAIWDAVHTECSIMCQKCKKMETSHNIDSYDFAERLYQKGWTFKRSKILCDGCSIVKH